MKINVLDFYDGFYSVSDPVSTKSYRGNIEDRNGDFGKLRRGDYLPSKLEVTHLEGGREPGYLFWCHVNDPFCVSEKVKEILIGNQISGISFIPTTVRHKDRKQNPAQFYTVIITGRVDAINYLNSDVRILKQDGAVVESAYFIGKKFDVGSWDSSDFFMERKDEYGNSTCHIYASRKVVDLFKKNKISNIKFEKLSQYETSCDMVLIGASEEMDRKINEKIANATVQHALQLMAGK